MALVDQNILITTEMIDNISGTVKIITKNVKDMNNGVRNVTQNVQQFNNGIMTTNQTLRSTTRGLQKFHFEWLSVMFVGMAINRVFGQYVKGAGEWLGATEAMTEGLKLSVFTALEPFHDTILNVSTALFDASPAMQSFVGWLVLGAAAVGMILSVLGQFFLGMQGLKLITPKIGPKFRAMFSVIATGFKAIIAFVAGLSAIVLVVIAAIIIAVVGMYLAFKDNFMNIKLAFKLMVDGFKKMFNGFIGFFRSAIRLVVNIFTGNWKAAFQDVKDMIRSIWDFFTGWLQALLSLVVIVSLGIVKAFKTAFDLIWKFFKALWDKLKRGFESVKGFLGFGGGDDNSSSTGMKSKNDFIWRPGQGAVSINPNDTLVGFKGAPPNLGGSSGVNFSPTTYFYGVERNDIERLIKDNNTKQVEDLKRLIQT